MRELKKMEIHIKFQLINMHFMRVYALANVYFSNNYNLKMNTFENEKKKQISSIKLSSKI